ncbi:MAG: hypothetical protein AAFR31_05990 [Cyanobacteria bacterium J06627_8]
MNIPETARETMAQKRHHQHHLEESMLERSEEEVAVNDSLDIQEEARESLVTQRKQTEHLEASMQSRAEAEIES